MKKQPLNWLKLKREATLTDYVSRTKKKKLITYLHTYTPCVGELLLLLF